MPFYLRIHSSFFKRLNSVDQVFVVGHSFGDVDLPYFKKVLENIQENSVWNIYYYYHNEVAQFTDKITSIGVNPKNSRMFHSTEFFNRV